MEIIKGVLIHVLVLIGIHLVICVDVCRRGEMLYTPRDGPDVCLECNGGTFMESDWHKERRCHDCSRIKVPFVDKRVSDCNRTHNAVILCAEGYYRTPSKPPHVEGQCKKCTDCEYPLGKCQGYEDTVCCPGESYSVRRDPEGKPVCIKECTQGEFVDVTSNECKPCPAGTYMPAKRHSAMQCWECPKPDSAAAEEILLPCTSTKPTVIGCKPGYYRDRADDVHNTDMCAKCRECLHHGKGNYYTGRECEAFQDTVCCPQAHMTVEDTPDGPVCKLPQLSTPDPEEFKGASGSISCGVDQYVYNDTSTGFIVCLPCPPDTYMDETDHRKTTCKDCAKFSGKDNYSTCQQKNSPSESALQLSPGMCFLLAINVALLNCVFVAIVLSARFLYRRYRGEKNVKRELHDGPTGIHPKILCHDALPTNYMLRQYVE